MVIQLGLQVARIPFDWWVFLALIVVVVVYVQTPSFCIQTLNSLLLRFCGFSIGVFCILCF